MTRHTMGRSIFSSIIVSSIIVASLPLFASCATKPVAASVPSEPAPPVAKASGDPVLVWPDEAFRAKRPEPGPTPQLVVPKPTRFTLKNGLEVFLFEQHELPTVSMSIRFETGGLADPKGKEGLASLAMDLFDESTERLDKVAFEEAQADLASSIIAATQTEMSSIDASSLSRHLASTLDLLAELLGKPGMRANDLERLRAQRQATLAQQKGAPASIGRRVYSPVLYGLDHPYGKIPTEASLAAVRLEDCKRYVSRLGPAGAKLYVAGDVSEAALRELLEQKLGAWKGKAPRAPMVATPKSMKGTIFFIDVPGAAQSQVYVGHLGPSRLAKDYDATHLMAQILGGSFSSRINMNIREKHGYAYGARAGYSYARKASAFIASSSVRSDVTGPSLREIANEIVTMRTSDAKPEEVRREQDGSILAMPADFATAGRSLTMFGDLVHFGLPFDYYDGRATRIRALDVQSIRTAAQSHLHDGAFKVLVVGDANVVLPELEKIASEGVFGKQGLVVLDADSRVVKRADNAKRSASTSKSTPPVATAEATTPAKPAVAKEAPPSTPTPSTPTGP